MLIKHGLVIRIEYRFTLQSAALEDISECLKGAIRDKIVSPRLMGKGFHPSLSAEREESLSNKVLIVRCVPLKYFVAELSGLSSFVTSEAHGIST